MVGVRVKIHGLGEAQAVLDEYQELFQDPLPLMEIAGGIMENSTRMHFQESKGPGGFPWPISKRAAAQGGRTLIDKGGLLSSVTSRAVSGHVEWGIMAKTPSAKHAASHQWGVTIRPRTKPNLVFRGADGHLVFAKSVTLPARPIVGIDETDKADLREAWTAYLEGMKG